MNVHENCEVNIPATIVKLFVAKSENCETFWVYLEVKTVKLFGLIWR